MKKIFFFLFSVLLFSCGGDVDDPFVPPAEESFDRKAMLQHWANNIIIPAYTAFADKTALLEQAGANFAELPSPENFENLKQQWESAYIVFQDVSMFEIGKAEELRFTNNLNIYPTNVEEIENNVLTEDYNLELPSQIDRQGFPALDYLLFGMTEKGDILTFYQNDVEAEKYRRYIAVLTERIDDLAQTILTDWATTYGLAFVENSGNSATASVDKLINDYIFYYEKHLRAGKVGIPAGVFSGSPLISHVEAPYHQELSATLLNRALTAVQHFFNGKYYNSDATDDSMAAYLDHLQVLKNEQNLSTVINNQFEAARQVIQSLNNNFVLQIEIDNLKLLEAYDQLQLNVVNLKVDMLQAFNINVDYVDADGD